MNTAAANSNKYANPTRKCDLVLKGGVTSGLVFPRAVLELADCRAENGGYSFDSIGGTSAGAVAAAFAAAAEYNRGGGGFERLEEVNSELQSGAGGRQGTFLRNLFQPQEKTEPLFNLILNARNYREAFDKIGTGCEARSRLCRLGAYARLARRVMRESGVREFETGSRLGALAGAVVGIALAISIVWTLQWFLPMLWPYLQIILIPLAGLFGIVGLWLGGLAGGVAGGLAGIYEAVTVDVPRNLFGICSGMPAAGPREHKAAAQWIHDSVQAIAGGANARPGTLTFGDLDSGKITLRVMATNVSEGRPYVLPFDEPFIFRQEDFDRLFPPDVVAHMVKTARRVEWIALPAGFHFLPARENFPVAVAARMSMSFPLFFSSVPLYALPMWVRELIHSQDRPAVRENLARAEVQCRVAPDEHLGAKRSFRALVEKLDSCGRWDGNANVYRPQPVDLIPHWFSDGGIVSNFPIHFFDQWLPNWPTFGITLRDLPGFLFEPAPGSDDDRAKRHYLDSIDRWEQPDEPENISRQVHTLLAAHTKSRAAHLPHVVVLPKPEQTVSPEWGHIMFPDVKEARTDAVPNFISAIVKTMQNYRDNAQAALASYRERIVQVRLLPNEGGFNLDMSRPVIESVVEKGKVAGNVINSQFEKEHHQWTRLRVLVAELDDVFRTMRKDDLDVRFEHLIAVQKRNQRFPHREEDTTWCADFETRLRSLRDAMNKWIDLHSKTEINTGEPPPELRVTPKM